MNKARGHSSSTIPTAPHQFSPRSRPRERSGYLLPWRATRVSARVAKNPRQNRGGLSPRNFLLLQMFLFYLVRVSFLSRHFGLHLGLIGMVIGERAIDLSQTQV